MRASVTVGFPLETTAGQLRALASLLRAVERQQWQQLADTFAKMADRRAELDDQLQAMLQQLASQLRTEAYDREGLDAPTVTSDRRERDGRPVETVRGV